MATVHREMLKFSVRCYSDQDLTAIEDLASVGHAVGTALGTSFNRGTYRDIDGLVGNFLGLTVGLYDWAGLEGPVIVLTSHSENMGFYEAGPGNEVDLQVVDISKAVADLLEVELGGGWHPPSTEELQAERQKRDAVVDRFARQERAEGLD